MDNSPMVTGVVLRPVEEVQQNQADIVVDDMLALYWNNLVEVCQDIPLRYDPQQKPPKREPESKFFHSGNGKSNNRVHHKRKRYALWSRQ